MSPWEKRPLGDSGELFNLRKNLTYFVFLFKKKCLLLSNTSLKIYLQMKKVLALGAGLLLFSLLYFSCQKSSDSPPNSDWVPHHSAVGERSSDECDECPDCFDTGSCCVFFDVEVSRWDSVTSIVFTYPNPADPFGSPVVLPITSAVPVPIARCVAPGTVTVTINGGPAAAYARSCFAPCTERTFYIVNNGSGVASCSFVLQSDCTWSQTGTCGGISQFGCPPQ